MTFQQFKQAIQANLYVTVWILYNLEQYEAFIWGEIVYCWLPLWSALAKNVPICLGLHCLRLKPVGGYNSSSLPHTRIHSHTHTHIHTVIPPFFALSHPSLPFSFLLCPFRLCVSMKLCCALWWPTSGTAVSHKSASSFNRYRQALHLCL